jgi:hypothetical protein
MLKVGDFPWIFILPLVAFLLLLLPAAVRLTLSRRQQRKKEGEAVDVETTVRGMSPCKSDRQSIELKEIPLQEVDTKKTAAPYVAIPAPFRISTASSHANLC